MINFLIKSSTTLISIFLLMSCQAQNSDNKPMLVGGRCEGCQAIYEYGTKQLKAVDTLPGFNSGSEKLKLTGTIYNKDGKSPAAGVIFYIYHTMAGPVRQPIDIPSLERYLEKHVPAIKTPISLKQVSQHTPPTSPASCSYLGGLI